MENPIFFNIDVDNQIIKGIIQKPELSDSALQLRGKEKILQGFSTIKYEFGRIWYAHTHWATNDEGPKSPILKFVTWGYWATAKYKRCTTSCQQI